MDTGNRIRKVRKFNNLSMKELGKMIGVSEQAISQYERGLRKVPLEVLFKISDALDVSVTYLDESRLESMNIYAKELTKPYTSSINKDCKNEEFVSNINKTNSLIDKYDEMISKLEKYKLSKSDTATLETFKRLGITIKGAFLEDLQGKNHSYQIGYNDALADSIEFFIKGLNELLQEYE